MDNLTEDERVWKVKVVRYTAATRRSKPTRENLGLLVAASTADDAMNYAVAYYVNNGAFGRVLHSVEARGAARVKFPMEIAP